MEISTSGESAARGVADTLVGALSHLDADLAPLIERHKAELGLVFPEGGGVPTHDERRATRDKMNAHRDIARRAGFRTLERYLLLKELGLEAAMQTFILEWVARIEDRDACEITEVNCGVTDEAAREWFFEFHGPSKQTKGLNAQRGFSDWGNYTINFASTLVGGKVQVSFKKIKGAATARNDRVREADTVRRRDRRDRATLNSTKFGDGNRG